MSPAVLYALQLSRVDPVEEPTHTRENCPCPAEMVPLGHDSTQTPLLRYRKLAHLVQTEPSVEHVWQLLLPSVDRGVHVAMAAQVRPNRPEPRSDIPAGHDPTQTPDSRYAKLAHRIQAELSAVHSWHSLLPSVDRGVHNEAGGAVASVGAAVVVGLAVATVGLLVTAAPTTHLRLNVPEPSPIKLPKSAQFATQTSFNR